MRNKKGNILTVVLAGFLVLALGVAGFFFWQNQQLQKESNKQHATSTNNKINFPAPSSQDETSGWKIYSNPELGFSIEFPSTMKISQKPVLFKDNNQNTSWTLALNDRSENDQSGTNIKTSVYVHFSQNPVSGETHLPIARIQDTFQGIENPEYFDIQGNDAVKLKKTDSSNEKSITIHILKDNSLWSLTGNTSDDKEAGVATIEQVLSTFKFIDTSQTSNEWKVFNGNSVKDTSFLPYTINYPSTWTKSIEYLEPGKSDGYYSLVISKNGYSLRITQAAFGVERCIFSDETTPQDSPYADLRNKKYTEFSGQLGRFRRYLSDSKQAGKSVIEMCIQQPRNSAFVSSSNAGSIQYWVPDNPDATTIAEMDSIIKSLQTKFSSTH